MADISSLYPQPPQQQSSGLNVLSNPAGAIDLLGKMNALNASTQDLKARQAIGEIYRKNIKSDGTLDEHGAIRGIADNPDTARLAPEAVGGMLQRQGQQLQNAGTAIQNRTAQMEQQAKAQAFTAGSFSMIDPTNPSEEQVHNWTVMMKRNFPSVPSPMINGMAQTALTDPAGLAHGVATMRNLSLGAGGSDRVQGAPDASGAPQQTTKAAANLAGTTPTGLPPGVGEAASAAGTGSGAALNDARLHSLNYRQEVFPLEQAISALERLGKTGTGPGAEEFNHFKSFLQSAGIPGLNVNKIKDFDEAKKYLTDFVNQNGNSQSVEHLRSAFGGSPSVNISNAAADEVGKSALTLRRMKEAQQQDFESSGLKESDYAKRAGQFARTHDPRAYGFDMMSVDQRRKVLASLPVGKALPNGEYPPGTRENFQKQVEDAHAQGIIKSPAPE